MVGRALSERVKKQKQRRELNRQYQEALDEYLREQARPTTPGHRKKGLRPIAEAHGVDYRALGRLAKGGQSISAFNASKQKLSIAEEHVLVDWILESSDRAMAPEGPNIETHANAIIDG